MICRCGADCETCQVYKDKCDGCEQIEGKVYWLEYIGSDVCPIYECGAEKGFAHCGYCDEIPCDIWYKLQDPAMTEDEHLQGIFERVRMLKANA